MPNAGVLTLCPVNRNDQLLIDFGSSSGEKYISRFYVDPSAFPGDSDTLNVSILVRYRADSDNFASTWRIYAGGDWFDEVYGPGGSYTGTVVATATGPADDFGPWRITTTIPRPTEPTGYLLTAQTTGGPSLNTLGDVSVNIWDPEAFHGTAELVFDMKNPVPTPSNEADQIGQWYEWTTPREPRAAVLHQGVVHWLGADDHAWYEDEGKRFDADDESIETKAHFAPLSHAGLLNAERVYRVQADGIFYGESTQRITADIVEERGTAPATWTDDVDMTDATNEEFEFTPDPGRATRVELTVEEVANGQLTEGWALKAIGFEVGVRGRMRKLGAGQQIGDEE